MMRVIPASTGESFSSATPGERWPLGLKTLRLSRPLWVKPKNRARHRTFSRIEHSSEHSGPLGLHVTRKLSYNGYMDDAQRIPLNGPETIDKATSRVEAGERVMLTRDGLDVAALVEPEAAALLEHLEDIGLASLAAERMAAFKASGEVAVPLADIARQMDLDATS